MNADNMLIAADTARMQAGGRSLIDTIGDAATIGVAGAVVSGYASIYNTAAWASNKVFGTDADMIDTGKVLGDVDANWRNYYETNKSAIDTVGFIGGAFIPGGLAVKGLNLARAGEGVGTFGRALGYTTRMQQKYLEAGLQQVAARGSDVFTSINRNKLASMAFGAVDNVLQTAVFETAAAITMSQSSVLAGEHWQDVAWDIAKMSLVGGVLGGGIEALWTNKIFRDAGKAVDAKVRPYDRIVAADKLNMSFGDKAFTLIDSMFELPAAVLESDKVLNYAYRLNGKNQAAILDMSNLLDKKLASTVSRAEAAFQQRLVEVVATDPSVGQPLSAAMLRVVHQGKAEGKTLPEIREELGTFLHNLHSVQGLGSASTDFTKDVIYLVPGASLSSSKLIGAAELFSPIRSSSSDLGYRVVGDLNQAKTAVLGAGAPATLKDSWAAGFDIIFSGAEGKVHINPNSNIFKAIADNKDNFLRMTMNTRTNKMTDTPIVTIADMAIGGTPVATVTGVQAGKYTFQFSTSVFEPTLDSIQNTARHLWASQLKTLGNVTVDARDFSLLDRIAAMDATQLLGAKIQFRMADGQLVAFEDVAKDYTNWVLKQKTSTVEDLFAKAKEAKVVLDTRQVAYAANVEHAWVDQAIVNEFNVAKIPRDGSVRNLESYAARDNVVMVYTKPPIADGVTPDFPDGYLGYQHRKALAIEQAEAASMSVFGKAGERFLDLDPTKRLQFDGTGTGPTAVGSSNANYGDAARVWSQDTGRATRATKQDFRNAALDPLVSHFQTALRLDNKELGAVLTRSRRTGDLLTLHEGRIVGLSELEAYEDLQKGVLAGKARQQDLAGFTFKTSIPVSDDTYQLLTTYHEGHVKWLGAQRQLAAAQGRTRIWSERALYLPPLDTKQFPYFAFVRAQEGRIFSSTETAMITAKTPEELQRLITTVEKEHPDLQVIVKRGSEEWFKAKGYYEYQSSMNAPSLDPLLRKQGKLGDYIPTLDAKAVVETFVQFIAKREDNLVRSAVDVKYGQTFEELRWLSDQHTKVATSKFGIFNKTEVKTIADPYGDYRRLALDISKKSEYTLWSDMNEFVDAVGKRAYEGVSEVFKQARAGKTDWLEANAALEKVGLSGTFSSQTDYLLKQAGQDRSLITMAVAKGNMLLANITLRLDAANALINVISTPIMLGMEVSAIRSSLRSDPATLHAFERNMMLSTPDGTGSIPSTIKLIHTAVANYFGKDKTALIERYEKVIGSIRGEASQFHDMLGELALLPNMAPAAWAKNVDKWMEKGASLTGNNMAEQFTRFVASDVMRQITEPVVTAGRMTVKEQNSFIAIFVNRTQGNYISSQRPIVFQGVLGSALSLFQTYQFNMFQQLFRHIENKDGRTLAVGAALQSTFFGLNGLPLFDAINTHLIGNANINEGHRDVYSSLAAANKDLGDFALYGAISAFPAFSDKAPALYTRGDLNPRHVSIIPTSFDQLPIVEAFSRVAKTVWGIGNQVAQGGNLGTAMLHGMEHNGISRPLAGLAQVLQGRSTTNSGSIISANNDLMSITTATRLLGAKPMDESIVLNHKYRYVAYHAADKERLEKLGTVIKQQITRGDLTEEDVLDFGSRYAAIGGRMQGYGAAMQRWTKAANESTVNTIMKAHGTTRGQRLFEVMGGDPLPDLYNTQQAAGDAAE